STHINLLYAYLFFFFTDTPTPEFYTLSLTTLFRSDDLEQARALRLADDDLGDVVGLREADEIVGDAAADAGDRQRLAAQRLGQPQRIGEAITLLVRELEVAPRLDRDRGPRSMDAIGEPLGVAHQAGGTRILGDADEDAFARRPGS